MRFDPDRSLIVGLDQRGCVHGRRDISGPAITPARLQRAWPGSRLEIVEPEGHVAPIETESTVAGIDAFAV